MTTTSNRHPFEQSPVLRKGYCTCGSHRQVKAHKPPTAADLGIVTR